MKEVINIFLGNNVNDGDDDDDDDDPCTVETVINGIADLQTLSLSLSLSLSPSLCLCLSRSLGCRLSLYGLNRCD